MNTRLSPDPSELALIAANLLPLAGVLWLDWDVASIVVLYWTENLVVGGYTILRLLVAARLRAVFPVLFFCLHYGLFCAIHGIFVLELTGLAGLAEAGPEHAQPPLMPFGQIILLLRKILQAQPPEFLFACLALLISHGASFLLLFIGRQEYRDQTVKQLMSAPYRRIVVLHIAVITGAFLTQRLGSPLGLLLALIALKIAMDIKLHRRAHAGQESLRPAATQVDDRL